MRRFLQFLTVSLLCITLSIPCMDAQGRGRESRSNRTERPAGSRGSSNHRGSGSHNTRPNNNRPSNRRPSVTPSNGGNHRPDGGGSNNRPGIGNGNNHRPDGGGSNNRPGIGNGNNHRPNGGGSNNRPGIGNGNNHRPDGGGSNNRPGIGNGNNHRPDGGNGYHPGNGGNHRPNGGYRPGPGGNHRPGIGNHHPGPRPPHMAPPPRPYRPPMLHPHYRPMPPRGWRPAGRIPIIRGILGLTFGTAINLSLDYLLSSGYNVDGYTNDIVYLRNVSALNYVWTDAALYYGNNGLDASSFYYSTPGYDLMRYNNVYNSLVATYGMPVSINNTPGMMGATWFGGNNGYVSLSFGSNTINGRLRYLTTLTFGL